MAFPNEISNFAILPTRTGRFVKIRKRCILFLFFSKLQHVQSKQIINSSHNTYVYINQAVTNLGEYLPMKQNGDGYSCLGSTLLSLKHARRNFCRLIHGQRIFTFILKTYLRVPRIEFVYGRSPATVRSGLWSQI